MQSTGTKFLFLRKKRYFEQGDNLNEVVVDEDESIDEDDNDLMELPKESKIGAKMSGQTLKKIIIIVLVLLMVVPMFGADYLNEEEPSYNFDAENFAVVAQCCLDGPGVERYANYLIAKYKEKEMPILNLTLHWSNDEANH